MGTTRERGFPSSWTSRKRRGFAMAPATPGAVDLSDPTAFVGTRPGADGVAIRRRWVRGPPRRSSAHGARRRQLPRSGISALNVGSVRSQTHFVRSLSDDDRRRLGVHGGRRMKVTTFVLVRPSSLRPRSDRDIETPKMRRIPSTVRAWSPCRLLRPGPGRHLRLRFADRRRITRWTSFETVSAFATVGLSAGITLTTR